MIDEKCWDDAHLMSVLTSRPQVECYEKLIQERKTVDLESQLHQWQEREAAVCPEDVGFEEYIKALQSQLQQEREKRKEAEADNAALVEYLESLLKYESISWMHGYIKDMIFKIHPGAALLEELEQLRAVAQDAQAMYLNWFSVYMKNPGPFHDAVINALNAAGYEVKRPLEAKEATDAE